jgi:IclR family pca regulon transcriptional regulator
MATGKLLLAYLPAVRRDAIVAGLDLVACTSRTITDRDEFRRHLDGVRRRGFAENVDESEIGVAALAVGVRGESGQVTAALGTCLPCVRHSDDRRRDLLAALRSAADAVETAWQTGHSA